jgi:hypothetical protein
MLVRFQTIRAAHRVAVDWVAETFHLPEDTARFHAEARARAATMAHALNNRETRHDGRRHHGRRQHAPRQARVLKGWQARIGRALGAGGSAGGPDGEAR